MPRRSLAIELAFLCMISLLAEGIMFYFTEPPLWLVLFAPAFTTPLLALFFFSCLHDVAASSEKAEDQANIKVSEIEHSTARLRHDIRGMLSPALLYADKLSTNPDPDIQKMAGTIIASIEQVSERLSTQNSAPPQR